MHIDKRCIPSPNTSPTIDRPDSNGSNQGQGKMKLVTPIRIFSGFNIALGVISIALQVYKHLRHYTMKLISRLIITLLRLCVRLQLSFW